MIYFGIFYRNHLTRACKTATITSVGSVETSEPAGVSRVSSRVSAHAAASPEAIPEDDTLEATEKMKNRPVCL